jgi:hypothetical protein
MPTNYGYSINMRGNYIVIIIFKYMPELSKNRPNISLNTFHQQFCSKDQPIFSFDVFYKLVEELNRLGNAKQNMQDDKRGKKYIYKRIKED